jgi:hypothetical protein
MSGQHTPGPWTVNGDGPWICTVGNNHDDPAIFGPRPADGEPFPFGDKTADARLIAAAPELLAALVEVANLTKRQQLPLTAQIHELANAALSKATA